MINISDNFEKLVVLAPNFSLLELSCVCVVVGVADVCAVLVVHLAIVLFVFCRSMCLCVGA